MRITYLIIGFIIGYLIGKYQNKTQITPSQSPNQANILHKKKNLDQITDYLSSHDQVTNNEIEKMLNISDATAERYLDELEREGKISQIGKTGRNVTYENPKE